MVKLTWLMINIFGIFFLSFLSLRKTTITVKLATIPTDAITIEAINTTRSICEGDPLIESIMGILSPSEILRNRLRAGQTISVIIHCKFC